MALGLGLGLPRQNPLAFGIATHLFAASEQGVWYDPSDLSTLYQDSAGTTPVTAMEQPVGLMLDKRLGFAQGPERIVNGTFDDGLTGWAAAPVVAGVGGAVVTLSAGGIRVTNDATGVNYGMGSQAFPTVVGKKYKAVLTRGAKSGAGTANFHIGIAPNGSGSTTTAANITGSGVIFTADATTTYVNLGALDNVASSWAEWDNISVREVSPNCATQPAAASRPVLSARKNLLLSTGDLTGAAWVAFTSLTKTATTLTFANVNSYVQHNTGTLGAAVVGTVVTFAATLSTPTPQTLRMIIVDGSDGAPAPFLDVNVTATPTRFVHTVAMGVGFSGNLTIQLHGNGVIAAGTVITVSEPQLEVAPTATRYQRVTTATDYDSVGFPHYLKFDGVDDFLSVPFAPTAYPLTLAAGVYASTAISGGILSVAASDSNYKQIGTSTSAGAYAAQDRNAITATAQSGVSSGPTVLLGEFGAASTDLYAGSAAVTSVANTNAYGVPTTLFIGKTRTAGLFYPGNLHAGVALARGLTSAERVNLKTYLASKAGATL